MRKLADKIMLTGFLVMLLGATGADSPGDGYLIAGAVVLAGCVLMAAGQRMEVKQDARYYYYTHRQAGNAANDIYHH